MLKQIIMDDEEVLSVEEFAKRLKEIGNKTTDDPEVVKIGHSAFLEMVQTIERETLTEYSLMYLLHEYTDFYMLKEAIGLTK